MIAHQKTVSYRKSDSPQILAQLAEGYDRKGQYLKALRLYDRIIKLGAATKDTWCRTGNTLSTLGEFAQAIGAYERCLILDDENPEAHHNLGKAHYKMGNIETATRELKIATAQSDSINSWLGLATIAPGCPQYNSKEILQIRRAFARKLIKGYATFPNIRDYKRPRSAHPTLRIGYLSAFLDQANYMKPVWGLINHHDRTSFEIHLFSDTSAEKGMAGYVRHPQDHVHYISELDNFQLAALVQNSCIDILIDLNGYSAPHRLPFFLKQMAPIVVAWFNMYATSGLPGIHYIIGDHEVIRPEEENFFSEKVLRLPQSYLTFEILHRVPPVSPLPFLKNGFITFGSLVSQYKITKTVLDAWAEILRRTKTSRLMIANAQLNSPCNREYLLNQFAERDIHLDRISLYGPAEHFVFLQHYDRMDIALDSFPYNGGTTTMEAIWQGIPVLTFDGDRWASRTSVSLLQNTHLNEFVSDDLKGYIELAIKLANDPDTPKKLKSLRMSMRQNLRKSKVCNTCVLAKGMENIYRQIWDERGE